MTSGALVARAPWTATGDRSPSCISLVESGGPDAAAAGAALYPHTGTRLDGRHHRRARRREVELTDALIGRIRRGRHSRSACSRSTRPARSAAVRSSATASACRTTPPTPACSSGRWRPAVTSAGSRSATPHAVRVLDAAGKPWIIVETVGVGQVEVEIAGAADTTVVVVNPGWGDGVQADKAGLMEIADLFVVNKADRDGVAETVRDLELHARSLGPSGVAPADRAHGRDARRGCRRALGRDR